MANGFIPAIAGIHELKPLHDAYLAMTGDKPETHWNQGIYDRLVMGLVYHAPALLAEKEKV